MTETFNFDQFEFNEELSSAETAELQKISSLTEEEMQTVLDSQDLIIDSIAYPLSSLVASCSVENGELTFGPGYEAVEALLEDGAHEDMRNLVLALKLHETVLKIRESANFADIQAESLNEWIVSPDNGYMEAYNELPSAFLGQNLSVTANQVILRGVDGKKSTTRLYSDDEVTITSNVLYPVTLADGTQRNFVEVEVSGEAGLVCADYLEYDASLLDAVVLEEDLPSIDFSVSEPLPGIDAPLVIDLPGVNPPDPAVVEDLQDDPTEPDDNFEFDGIYTIDPIVVTPDPDLVADQDPTI